MNSAWWIQGKAQALWSLATLPSLKHGTFRNNSGIFFIARREGKFPCKLTLAMPPTHHEPNYPSSHYTQPENFFFFVTEGFMLGILWKTNKQKSKWDYRQLGVQEVNRSGCQWNKLGIYHFTECLCHVRTAWPQESQITTMRFRFLLYKMKMKIPAWWDMNGMPGAHSGHSFLSQADGMLRLKIRLSFIVLLGQKLCCSIYRFVYHLLYYLIPRFVFSTVSILLSLLSLWFLL